VRLAAVLAGMAIALGASSALGTEEALPGGPPACSVLVNHSSAHGGEVRLADVWVQCNYEVTELTLAGANRRVKHVPRAPELVGARPADSMVCGLNRSGRARCSGRLEALARVHARLRVDEAICRSPRLRVSVHTFGGPPCEGICPEVGFSNRAVSATDKRSMGCLGG
jgi:hypothetical protein